MSDKSLNMSLPCEKVVHGVKIRKLPNGKYFRVLQILQEFPGEVLNVLYPDKTPEQALEEMGEITFDKILEFLPKLIAVIPDKTFNILAEILEIDRKVLDEDLDPLQTIEILEEFAKLNRFDELKKKLSPMLKKIPVLNQIMRMMGLGSNM